MIWTFTQIFLENMISFPKETNKKQQRWESKLMFTISVFLRNFASIILWTPVWAKKYIFLSLLIHSLHKRTSVDLYGMYIFFVYKTTNFFLLSCIFTFRLRVFLFYWYLVMVHLLLNIQNSLKRFIDDVLEWSCIF